MMEKITPTFMEDRYSWIRSRIPLDLLTLDEALEELPSLIQEAGELTSAAIEIREVARQELSLIESQIAERLRNSTSGSRPASETTIQSKIPLDSEYQEAQKSLGTSRLDAALWGNLVESLRKKDSSIRTSSELMISGWISKDFVLERRRREIRNVKVQQ